MADITGTKGDSGGTTTMQSEHSEHSEHGARASMREKAHETRERISSKARETGARVRTEGEDMLRDQKSRVADRIGHYGSAVHRAAHQLEDEQDAAIAFYTHRAADQLDRAAQYLRERDWQHLRRDAEQFARRHQELFFGGLLLGGIALARLLKASQERAPDPGGSGDSSKCEETRAELDARYETPYVPTAPPKSFGSTGADEGGAGQEQTLTAAPGATSETPHHPPVL